MVVVFYVGFCFLAQWDYYTYCIQCTTMGVTSMRCSVMAMGTRRGSGSRSGCQRRPGCTLMFKSGEPSALNLSYSMYSADSRVLNPECTIAPCCDLLLTPKNLQCGAAYGELFEKVCIQYYPILPYPPLPNPTCNTTYKIPYSTSLYPLCSTLSNLNKHIQNAQIKSIDKYRNTK